MTVARLNRGKTRFIVGVVALLLVLGFVAIFQNNQQENDELRELSIRCEQQLGGMQAQSSRASMEYKKLEVELDKRNTEVDRIQGELDKAQLELGEEKRKFETIEQEYKISKTHKGDENEQLRNDIINLKEQIDRLQKEKEKEAAVYKNKLQRFEAEEDIETVSKLKQQTVRLQQEVMRLQQQCSSAGIQAESSSPIARKSPPSVDTNFSQQIIPKRIEEPHNVLQQPQLLNVKVSSSTTTTTTESSRAGPNKLDAAPNLQAPLNVKASSTTTKRMQVPEGVVPIPQDNFLIRVEDTNNRYSNVVEEKAKEDGAKDDINFMNGRDDDNMANEVPDTDFNMEEKKQKAGLDNGDNNAEEDTNLYEANKGIFLNGGKDSDLLHKKNPDLKLKHEVIDDQGKEGENDYHNEDVHLDAQQEEGGDTDDYDEHNVNAAEPVIRNK